MAINAKPAILYNNLFALGTPTATDTDADTAFNVLNLIDRRPYTFWRAASSGTKRITIDCATAQSADALGIIAHNLYGASATVSVESSTNNSTWTTRLTGFTPTSDKALLKTFTSASARYWRVTIVTASIVPYMAVVYLGAALTMEKYPESNFDPYNETPQAVATLSETGNLLGVMTSYVQKTITAAFKEITPTWALVTFKAAWDAHFKYFYPFFWAWDLTNHPTEVDFVRMTIGKGLAMPFDPVRQTLTLNMEGIVE